MKALRHTLQWQFWAHSLFSAFIGGGAAAVGAMVIDPQAFNIHEQLSQTVKLFIGCGVISSAMYLMKSPLPKLEVVEADEETKLTTKDSVRAWLLFFTLAAASSALGQEVLPTLVAPRHALLWDVPPTNQYVTDVRIIATGKIGFPYQTNFLYNTGIRQEGETNRLAVTNIFQYLPNGEYTLSLYNVNAAALESLPASVYVLWLGQRPPPPTIWFSFGLIPTPPTP
jgi:hypothetical protein